MPHDPEFSGGSIAIVVIFISKLLKYNFYNEGGMAVIMKKIGKNNIDAYSSATSIGL